MKIRRTFHIERETNTTINDIYMYFMQQDQKHTYSEILSEAVEVLKKKILEEKEAGATVKPKDKK